MVQLSIERRGGTRRGRGRVGTTTTTLLHSTMQEKQVSCGAPFAIGDQDRYVLTLPPSDRKIPICKGADSEWVHFSILIDPGCLLVLDVHTHEILFAEHPPQSQEYILHTTTANPAFTHMPLPTSYPL